MEENHESYDGYFRDLRGRQNNAEALRELSIFESFLRSAITVDEAAKSITARGTDRSLPARAKVGRLWSLFYGLAIEYPSADLRIINLYKAIIALPRPTEKSEIDWIEEEEGFGWLCRDWNDSLLADTKGKMVVDRDSSLSIGQRWTNFHAFTATGAQAGVTKFDGTGLPVIIDALEHNTKIWERSSETIQQLEIKVPAASQWFLHASRHLLQLCRNEEKSYLREESELWKGKPGFSKERWEFWKERLAKLVAMEELSESTRDLARSSGVAMGKAERSIVKNK